MNYGSLHASTKLWFFFGSTTTCLYLSKVLAASLAAGARRRALSQLATPPPALGAKRPLRKSPETNASTASPATVTPDPKRLMTSSSEKGGSESSGSKDVPTSAPAVLVPPVELFPDAGEIKPMDTSVDKSPSAGNGGVTWTLIIKTKVYIYSFYIYIYIYILL